MDVCQPIISPLKLVGKLFVIDPQYSQNGRLQVMNMDGIFRDIVSVLVRFPESNPLLDARTSHPNRKTTRMMVPSLIGGSELALRIVGPAEFAAPDNKRVVQQTSLF